MCQTFFPPVKVGLSHFIDIVHLVYNKEGIAPDFESSDCQLPSQLHSHNQRLILRNVVGTRFEESERMREKMPFWCDENDSDPWCWTSFLICFWGAVKIHLPRLSFLSSVWPWCPMYRKNDIVYTYFFISFFFPQKNWGKYLFKAFPFANKIKVGNAKAQFLYPDGSFLLKTCSFGRFSGRKGTGLRSLVFHCHKMNPLKFTSLNC